MYFVGRKCHLHGLVVGANGKGIGYSSIRHVFRIKNYLRNRGNTKNNEKVIYFSVANSFLPKACLL